MTKKSVLNLKTGVFAEVDLSPEEQAEHDAQVKAFQDSAFDRKIKDLRTKRNNLLTETDWMANSDVTMSDDWKTYRQQLRDLPSGLDTAEKVEAKEFPTKPGA